MKKVVMLPQSNCGVHKIIAIFCKKKRTPLTIIEILNFLSFKSSIIVRNFHDPGLSGSQLFSCLSIRDNPQPLITPLT